MASLLLVDDQVRMYNKIIDAAKPTTTVIVFNRLTSSLDDIIHQIEALPNREFTSIGLVQDGTNRMADYRIVYDQSPCALDNLETEGLASWSPVITFLQSLKSLTGMVTFDFISCLLGANPGFSYAISQISTQLGIVLQASTDMAGNLAQGGNWVQESDNVNIQDVYFTEDIAGYTELLYKFNYTPSTEMITELNTGLVSASGNRVLGMKTFAQATLYAWGASGYGGISGGGLVTGSGYTAIASNQQAFAALTSSGTIYAWGDSFYGGSGAPTGTGYTAIASSESAFAALKSDGTIFAWGYAGYGGIGGLVTGSGYTAIASSQFAFAALNSDKTIYAWGFNGYGGISGISGTAIGGLVTGSGYTAIASNRQAFAALKSDTTIYAWGATTLGGIGTITGSGYTAIASNDRAFAALKSDTTIYAWGSINNGGISGISGAALGGFVTGSGYTAIATGQTTFAALKSDTTIYAWGDSRYGGISGASGARIGGFVTGSGYTAIASNYYAFAALKSDTTIYAWGSSGQGGIGALVTGSGYTAIASNQQAFAALNSDKTIYAWGNAGYGGISGASGTIIGGFVTGSGYTEIASAYYAFAALKSDKTIYAWGDSRYGGISGASGARIGGLLTGSGYTEIASSNYAFVAIHPSSGGGSGGDPYVTTISNIRYKLPAMNASIRFYQGFVDGKLLTINAQLRTTSNSDMIADNIRSYFDFKHKVPAHKLKELEYAVYANEDLCFYEKFYVSYNGSELVINVWDHKFKIEKYKGKISSETSTRTDLISLCTGAYDKYDSNTLKFSLGSANLYITVYPNKLVRNSIYLEAPGISSGNGVIVNTLSVKHMTLESLDSHVAVVKKDSAMKEKEEWFLDHVDYRKRKFYIAH